MLVDPLELVPQLSRALEGGVGARHVGGLRWVQEVIEDDVGEGLGGPELRAQALAVEREDHHESSEDIGPGGSFGHWRTNHVGPY